MNEMNNVFDCANIVRHCLFWLELVGDWKSSTLAAKYIKNQLRQKNEVSEVIPSQLDSSPL